MSIGCMMGGMDHPHAEHIEAVDHQVSATASEPPRVRRLSLVGALGSLTRAHARAVSWLEFTRAEKRPAWRTPLEHRAAIDTAAARVDGLLARMVAIRAELHSLDVRDGRCHARCRDGHACRAPVVRGRRRCKLHGGLSTGPRTPEGRERALAALAFAHARRRQQRPAELDAVTADAA